jgi:hypothetical protein
MPRQRNKSGPSRTSPTTTSFPKSAAFSGLTGGSAVYAIAQSLPEPYHAILSSLAPAIASGITAVWPRLQANLGISLQKTYDQWKLQNDRRELNKYISRWNRELSDPATSEERREVLRKKIAASSAAIDNKEDAYLINYLIGDSVAGLHAKTETEDKPEVLSPPPISEKAE